MRTCGEEESLYQLRLGTLCFGISTRGNVVVSAAPCAKWSVGRVWPDVLDYYTKKGARIERVDVNALKVSLDPPRAGPARTLDPKSVSVQDSSKQTFRIEVEGDIEMAKKKVAAKTASKTRTQRGVAKAVQMPLAGLSTEVDKQAIPPLPGTAGVSSIDDHGGTPHDDLPADRALKTLSNAQLVAHAATAIQRPFVLRAHGNVQGGIDCRLSRLNLIVGPNTTKKTAVERTVELALSGVASDIRWRATVAAERDLLRLVRDSVLTAEVELSDGKVSHFGIGEGGGKKGVLATPYAAHTALIFPLRALREALLGTPDTLRKFFLGFAVGKLTLADIHSRIANIHHKRLETVGLTADVLDIPTALVNAIDECGKRARGEAKKAGTVEEVANVQGNTLAPDPTAEQMAAARTRFTNAQRYHTVASLNVSYNDTRARMADYQKERAQLTQQLEEGRAHYPPPTPGVPAANAVGPIEVATVGFLDYHVQHALTMCLGCGTQNIPTAEFARRRDGLIGASANATQERADYAKGRALIQQWENRCEVLDGLIAQFASTLGEVEQAAREWNGLPTVEWAQTERDAAQSALAELEKTAAAWKVVHNTQKQGAGAENLSEQWKLCGKELKRVAAELLGGGIDAFRARVQKYLPASDTFVIEVDDKSAEVGLLDGDKILDTALSGAQGVRVQLAIAAAIIEEVPRDVPVILTVEDRSIDADTVEATMRALALTDAQVLFVTTTTPSHIPEQWSVIRTDRGDHTAFQASPAASKANGAA